MYLKSLIIKGFKTFADKEELTFESSTGITAVVGPNGCGKSNVVDAFRFSLGESNLRGLRVHSLPEVIFSGTLTKRQLSLAEVSLVFDNTAHTLPIDYSEVSVKRRTFRDGESEFLINNQVSRLKDIRDLFLDSGISTESISIMSQGNVDAVLSSKPDERRSVFEEVAGINKYKFRKLEAERKLILSEQNLLRISDLKVEVGEQLISLESQAKAAREYRDIQTQLKQIELSTYKKQAKLLLEKKDSVTKELDECKKHEQEKEEQRRKLMEERSAQSSHLRQIETDIEKVFLEIEKYKSQIEEERGNLILEKERHLFLEKEKLRDLKEEDRFLRFEIKRLDDAMGALGKKREELVQKGKEISDSNLDEFGDFKNVISLTSQASQTLKKILVMYFGKSWEDLKESSSSERFHKLLDAEMIRLDEDSKANAEEKHFKLKKLEELKTLITHAETNLNELAKKTDDFIKTPSGQNIESLILARNGQLKKLEGLKNQKESISIKLEELEKDSFGGFSGSTVQTPDFVKLEIALARLDTELAQIETHIREEYNMSYEDLLSLPDEAANISKGKKEIEAFKYRLRELEPVNLLAIDEYDKCRERFSFIETQHQDIVMARENLKTLITELDLKAREDFIKSMEILGKNFSEVFQELFPGGEAQIVIETGKDALEAGIEINVRPPHRKWGTLSLLSGGERSLTAIALLFAILNTSPSPLIILDEVDAALDDANVDRFAQYLKKFAAKTQIIVITHNKQTMAVADTIYGITMEEPGVSRVLSMKLEKAN